MPMTVEQMRKFEIRNTNISINIFKVEKKINVVPYYKSINKDLNCHKINLLLIFNEEGNSHYIYIKNLAKLIDGRRDYKFICHNCLTTFTSKQALHNHEELCNSNTAQKITLSKEEHIKFTDYYMKSWLPFFITYDFESTLKPLEIHKDNTEKEKKIQIHEANSYGCYFHSEHEHILKSGYYSYFGEDSVDKFIELIVKIFEKFDEVFKEKNK